MFRKHKRSLSLILMLLMMPLDMATKKVYAAGTMQIGDYVQFGKYYGKPILWKVINIDADGSPMLYSEKILCVKPFDAAESGKDGRTGSNPYSNDEDRQRYGSNKWENSNIREWLNSNETKVTYTTQAPTNEAVWDGYNDYADEAGFLSNFSESERAAIKPVTHKSILAEIDKGEKEGGTEKHQWNYSIDNVVANYDKAYYKNVTDKVYFLDVKELYDYVYKRNLEYRKMPTEEAVKNSEWQASYFNNREYWWNWLRTPSPDYSYYVRYVYIDGDIDDYYANINYGGVVPALNLSSAIFKSGKGTVDEPYIPIGGE